MAPKVVLTPAGFRRRERLTLHVHRLKHLKLIVKVAASETIDNVKATIARHLVVPMSQLRLRFYGTVLENQWTLSDYNIQDGNGLMLYVVE